MVKEDIDKWSASDKCTIYSIDDYIDNLKGSGLLEEELYGRTEEEYKKDLESGKAPADHESGIYNGCGYVIEFEL